MAMIISDAVVAAGPKNGGAAILNTGPSELSSDAAGEDLSRDIRGGVGRGDTRFPSPAPIQPHHSLRSPQRGTQPPHALAEVRAQAAHQAEEIREARRNECGVV